jgi:hypothetical protein
LAKIAIKSDKYIMMKMISSIKKLAVEISAFGNARPTTPVGGHPQKGCGRQDE